VFWTFWIIGGAMYKTLFNTLTRFNSNVLNRDLGTKTFDRGNSSTVIEVYVIMYLWFTRPKRKHCTISYHVTRPSSNTNIVSDKKKSPRRLTVGRWQRYHYKRSRHRHHHPRNRYDARRGTAQSVRSSDNTVPAASNNRLRRRVDRIIATIV